MKKQVIILAARNQVSVSNYNSQMIPIHGKPAISWIIDLYYDIKDVLIVINAKNKLLYDYIRMNYPNATCVLVNQDKMYEKYGQNSILTSLSEGILGLRKETSVIDIVLGDTYYAESNYDKNDYILTANDSVTSEKWCLIEKDEDGVVKKIYDKEKNVDIRNKEIVTGFYHFSNLGCLKECIAKELKAGHESISNLIIAYNAKIPVNCITNNNWIDFGHRSGIIKAQKQFYNSRNFNSIAVDEVKNILVKSSEKKQKLNDEYQWYIDVPAELQSFVPRVYDAKDEGAAFKIAMENYGYPPLSELWLYGDYDFDLWQLITKRLIDIRLFMNNFCGTLDKENYESLYVSKFFGRLGELEKLDTYWKNLMSQKSLVINEVEYKNISFFEERLKNKFKEITSNAKTTVMHGDYCFSNILFDTQNFVCKMIDPRGRLLEQTIYGDSRYDFAKLRHSLAGNYDYVVHGLYTFDEHDDEFSYKDGCSEDRTPLVEFFDSLLIKNGYDIREIKLIEASLFLSMIPLHTDSFEQQKIFYIKGIQKLNECFEE